MLVEHADTSVLIDPWLVGSCYWRSWWNYPEPPRDLIDALTPDYIYITHLHWDHFHGPSLRRFDRETRVLVPQLPTTRRMVEDLAYLGFRNVVEVPHGGRVALGGGLELHSFQAGPGSDSSLVVSDGTTTLLNVNDCKLFGHTLGQIVRRFPKIDFVFRSHSSASPTPYCIEGFEEHFAELRPPEQYAEEFARFSLFVGARHAIPFASNHCYLHRETRPFNALVNSPASAQARTRELAAEFGREIDCVVMPPGSAWDDRDGFEIEAFDYGEESKARYIAGMLEKHREALENNEREEAEVTPNEESFVRYFEPMMRSLSGSLARRFVGELAFDVGSAEDPAYWVLDFAAGRIRTDVRDKPDVVIRTPAAILNDCCEVRMFATWSASKRLRISLAEPEMIRRSSRFFGLLDLFELGFLSPGRHVARRSLVNRTLRWREVIDAGHYVVAARRARGETIDLYPLNR
jgi:UDP-MurNAc hydroxylase